RARRFASGRAEIRGRRPRAEARPQALTSIRAPRSKGYSPARVSGYTTQDVARMIGVSAGRLRAYLRAGVLSPEKGTRGELRFSFQDLLLLRTAEGLVGPRVSPQGVRAALKKLRARLPDAQPLTG